MAGTRTLKVEILGDAKGLGAALGETDSKMSKLGKGLGSAGKLIGGAMLGIGGAALAIGPSILSAGAELEALGKKAETVFSEGSLAQVQSWAKGVAGSMGLTEKQAVGVAAGIGDLLKPMGFTADQAAEMSTKMLDLSGALSAWSGGTTSATEVADIMTKALLGETDGLKALGISISAADVAARLAEKGQQDLTGAALAQAEALAIQELIFEKSTDAQTAWANGSMDAVKKQAEMKAGLERLKETLITAVYPALQKLVPILTDAFTWLGEKIPGALKTVGEFFTSVFEGGKQVVSDLADTFNTSEGTIVKVLAGITAGLVGLAVAWNAGPGLIATAIVGLVAGFLWAYNNIEGFRTGVQTAFKYVKAAFDGVTSAAAWLWAGLQGLWDKAEGVRGFLADVFSVALGVVKTEVGLLTGAFGLVVDVVQKVWDKTESVREFLAGAFKLGLEVAGKAVGVLGAAFEKIIGWLGDIIGAAKDAVDWIARVTQADLDGKINPNIGKGSSGGSGSVRRSAFGNTLRAGEATLVGERGRSELFIPTVDGTVLPALGGDTYIFNTGAVISERQLTDIVHEGLLRKKRSSNLALA